jgi:hypothetical protein
MKAARLVWSGNFRWISQRSWELADAMSQAVLMRMVLDVAVWQLFILRGWVGFPYGLVYQVSLHSFSPEVCFDKMWSGRYTCPVPYIDSDLIKPFVSIISMRRVYPTARATSRLVMDLVRLQTITEIVQSEVMTTSEDMPELC